jgi:hypothetical protein
MDNINRILRAMAWQRVKGELEAIRQTYFNEMDKFDSFDFKLHKFIDEVEDSGCVE